MPGSPPPRSWMMSGELVPAGQLHLSVRNFPAVSPSPLWVGMRPGTGAGASARAPCRTPPPGPPSTPPALQGGRCCPLGAPTLLLMSRGDVREQAAGPMIPAGPGGAHSPLDGASEAWTACFSAQENAAGAASPSHPGPHPLFRKSEQGQEVVGVPGPSWATGPSARSPAGVRRAETGLHGPRGPRGRGAGRAPRKGGQAWTCPLLTTLLRGPPKLTPAQTGRRRLRATPGCWAEVLKPICHSGFSPAVSCLLPLGVGRLGLPVEEGARAAPACWGPGEGQRVLVRGWVGWGRGG